MTTRRRLFLLFVLILSALFLLPATTSAQDGERITSFDSAITVNHDGSMRVEDTIKVVSQGISIVHGIYYDFPTIYSNPDSGGRTVISFTVLGVQRDGRTEPYTVENQANGKRVKMGSASVTLAPGEHTYVLRYTVDREIGFFADHDELYWNVTGNGWAFPIEHASATVTLPSGAAAKITGVQAYTGPQGSTAANYTVSKAADGTPTFATTATLNSGEGLTIVVGWPKGYVEAPTAAMRFDWFLRDNSALIVGIVGFLLVLIYYMTVWYRYGKDPARGTIFAQFAPPEGMSPAGVRFLARQGYDNKAFSAALINMAVKRYITIHQERRRYWIERDTGTEASLSDDEMTLAGTLLAGRTSMEFKQENYEDVQSAITAHKRPLTSDYQPRYFVSNSGYVGMGILFSVGVIVLTFLLSNQGSVPQPIAPIVLTVALIIVGVIFSITLKSYTHEGRKLMDAVEGFKLYLSVAEKDRMNLLNPPDRTPELFEKYLPFALALGVEQRWSEQFASVFAHMEAEGHPYVPLWYVGPLWNPRNPAVFAENLGTGFSNTISASSTPPGSKSGFGGGGGGGFSGGGGGGGGGGGW